MLLPQARASPPAAHSRHYRQGGEVHAHPERLRQLHGHGQGPRSLRSVTSLIKEGIEIGLEAPRYLYTKLSELKINMLAEATKDATSRAEQIINNANGRLGKLVEPAWA